MKKIIIICVATMAAMSLQAQVAHIYYRYLKEYFCELPSTAYCSRYDKTFEIRDSAFIDYLLQVINNSTTYTYQETDCYECRPILHSSMIHIDLEINDTCHHIINITADLAINGLPKCGCLEIDGKVKTFDAEFQDIMDNIVDYYVVYKPSYAQMEKVVAGILKGKRYRDIRQFEIDPPIPPK